MSNNLIKEEPSIINVHGFPSTEKISDWVEWQEYAKKRLDMVKNRISIRDFLNRNQFINSKKDTNPEPRRVKDKFDDPIPPDTSGGARVGQRRTGWKPSYHPDYATKQRREWGFREKMLQGYPQYDPDKIGYGELQNKVIAGFVTVGDGVFSGIPSYANIKLDKEETRRQIEYGYGRVTGKEMIPTGLCFIQDETAGIGVALGSDVRYIWHPRLYGTNLSNANLMIDDMHMGATTVPKADYRQFLRVGDFVIIEIGTRLKYWHSLLGGSRPDYWESLVGYGELYDNLFGLTQGNPETGQRRDVQAALEQRISGGLGVPGYVPRALDQRNRDIDLKTLNSVPKIFGTGLNFRDVPSRDMGQPVIDHPWSTGTPIPVNSGMPYIMMEDYAIDSTERMEPGPLLIKAPFLRDLSGDGSNNGSLLKGQLVRLNNLRFVKPPKTRMISAEIAENNEGQLSPGLYTDTFFKYLPAVYRINDSSGRIRRGGSIEIAESLERQGTNLLLEYKEPYPASYYENNYKGPDIWKHKLIKRYGVDYTGHKFELPSESERVDLLPYEYDTPVFDPISGLLLTDRWDKNALDLQNPKQREGKDGYLYRILSGFLGITLTQERVDGSWPDIIFSDEMKENFYNQTNRNGLLYYNYVGNVNQGFPKSIDSSDGAYWFTNPNIPLTNAIEIGPPEAESTWLVSSTKVPAYIQRGGKEFRTVADLSRGLDVGNKTYYYHYENNPEIQKEWNGKNLLPEDSGYFMPNKTYYLSDQDGVVIPIRINANTEIARFKVRIPTGLVDIIGIAWQYSLGTPGMEWERESYMMQVWPRFLSDIIPFEQGIVVEDDVNQIDEVADITDTGTPDVPVDRRPTRLPDRTIDTGDAIPVGSISRLDCDFVNEYFRGINAGIQSSGTNQPLEGCDGLQPGQEIYYIFTSSIWYGITRTFYFRKDANGNCTCLLVPRGTNVQTNQQNIL